MAIPASIRSHLEHIHGFRVQDESPVGGGCIHQAHRLETDRGSLFLKFNHQGQAHNFEVESKGLDLLGKSGIITVPRVLETGVVDQHAYLLMEFVESGRGGTEFWEALGRSLAHLHLQTSSNFGLDYDNYIGALPQSNHWRPDWTVFFIEERLQPMIRMARDRGEITQGSEQFIPTIVFSFGDIFSPGTTCLDSWRFVERQSYDWFGWLASIDRSSRLLWPPRD